MHIKKTLGQRVSTNMFTHPSVIQGQTDIISEKLWLLSDPVDRQAA